MAIQIQLQSTNYNGQLADITFYPCSGGTISLGYQPIPYTYTNNNYQGTYDLYFSAFNQTCQLVITCPTPTPTITPTNTATPTPTLTTTPTNTPTLTQTPTPSPGPSFDPDATTYINAVIAAGGTLTAPQQTAINTFFVGLKADGIYNKFYYLHLFLGGTAGSNAINAKTPGTYNLSFQGTWTHSVSGSTTIQNNSNYAESGFLISSASPSTTQTDFSFGYMLSNRNTTLTPYQYQGIGTGADYMIIGNQWNSATNGVENYYSQIQTDFSSIGKTGVWNSISRTAVNSYFTAALFNGASVSGGLLNTATNTDVFTPSANVYDLNLFRVNGLNQFTLGGNALLNYASTSLSSAQLNSFATRANTLQIAFARNIFTI